MHFSHAQILMLTLSPNSEPQGLKFWFWLQPEKKTLLYYTQAVVGNTVNASVLNCWLFY